MTSNSRHRFTLTSYLLALATWISLLAPGGNAVAAVLFATNYNSGSVYEFTPNGTQSTFASGLSSPTAPRV